jgi:hypothetical protein
MKDRSLRSHPQGFSAEGVETYRRRQAGTYVLGVPRKLEITMSRIRRAAAAAGDGATEDDVIKHYQAPILAKYFATVASRNFLIWLEESATKQSSVHPRQPDEIDKQTIKVAAERAGSCAFELICLGTVVSSILLAWFTRPAMSAIPFALVALVSLTFRSNIRASVKRKRLLREMALEIAASAVAYERTRADFWRGLHWRDLELEIALLFERRGYSAIATPPSGVTWRRKLR